MHSITYRIHRFFIILLVFCAITGISLSQTKNTLQANSYRLSTFTIFSQDTTVFLPHQFIINGSETVLLDSVLLQRNTDYVFDARFGTIKLKQNASGSGRMLNIRPSESERSRTLLVRYQSFPFSFKPSYRHREPVTRIDSATGQPVTVVKPASGFSVDDLFGSNLQKSGSIVRGFTIGSNRDLSLNSGFRMQMSGNISDDVDIVAALTDENSPIQPEGTTQTLQEIDKVFVEIRSSNLSATLGDFYFTVSGNEFGNLNRKLQGAKGQAVYQTGGTKGDLVLAGAATRGKFTTNQFQGLDGVQGPYRLVGKNNERTIIVIAGTEKIYVNGEPMTRGEVGDYVIDYANGEMTFTSKRLVTSVSRIIVDFEYTDRQFNRSLIGGKSNTIFFNNRVSLSATVFKESDDENSLIDASLSSQDKDTLQAAGDDRLKAVRSGVEFVGAGKGQYAALDTLIASSPTRIYRYMPQDTLNALYAITFSFVGNGNGDYRKISLGQYQFVGIRQGSYAPIRFLPVPQSHVLTDFDIRAQLSDQLKISGEYALSNFDANRLSNNDDNDNTGSALKFGLQFTPQDVTIGGKNIGSFDLNVLERYVGKRFVAVDRTNEIEFNRKWNVTDSSAVDEEIREGALTYRPIQSVAVGGSLGRIKRGDLFSSNRYTASASMLDSVRMFDYHLEYIKSNDAANDLSGNWIRHQAKVQYKFATIIPDIRYQNETFWNKGLSNDGLKQGSFRYNEIIPGFRVDNIGRMSLSVQYGWRWDDSLLAGKLERASRTMTQRYGWQLQEWNDLSSTFDLTINNRTFTDAFRRRNNIDIETILLRSQTRFNPLKRGIESDWFYEVATERSAKLERVFQRVQKGTGNYVYLGDVNHNNISDEQDFQLTRFDGDYVVLTVPTDDLTPVIDLKASTRIRFNGSRLFASSVGLVKALSTLTSETYLRVEEKSSETDTKQIYLLHFDHFLDEQTTVSGSNLISQDIYFQENSPEFSLRFRFLQRRGLTKFALLGERTYNKEQSVRIRWQFIKEISNQIDLIHKNDNVLTSQASNRSRYVASDNIVSDWSYRPEQNVELGFKIGVGQATNFDTTRASLNDQSVRMVYAFEEKGQARGELTREEVNIDNRGLLTPFELTNGKIEGKTWLWRLGFDYKVTRFIQATLNYDGRSEGGGTPIHTARAEVRAFF